jgi:hypothetical protein
LPTNVPLYKFLERAGYVKILADQDLTKGFSSWDNFYRLTQLGMTRQLKIAATDKGKQELSCPAGGEGTLCVGLVESKLGKIVQSLKFKKGASDYGFFMAGFRVSFGPPYRQYLEESKEATDVDYKLMVIARYDLFEKKWVVEKQPSRQFGKQHEFDEFLASAGVSGVSKQ